jgi:hypothetical protein
MADKNREQLAHAGRERDFLRLAGDPLRRDEPWKRAPVPLDTYYVCGRANDLGKKHGNVANPGACRILLMPR